MKPTGVTGRQFKAAGVAHRPLASEIITRARRTWSRVRRTARSLAMTFRMARKISMGTPGREFMPRAYSQCAVENTHQD